MAEKIPALLIDGHGCVLKRESGSSEAPDVPLTDRQWEYIRELVEERDIDKLLAITVPISPHNLRYYGKAEEEYLHRTIENLGLTYTRGFHLEHFIKPYHIDEGIKPTLDHLELQLGRLRITTGTPACCAYFLQSILAEGGVWPFLDPDYSIFMTPPQPLPGNIWPDKIIRSSGSKVAAMAASQLIDGVAPFFVDDRIEFVEYAAFGFNTQAFCTTSFREATDNRRFDLPLSLRKHKSDGDIKWGWTMKRILEEYFNLC